MPAVEPILAILIPAAAAVLLTLLLRAAGLARAAIVGGLVAGVLVGATVLGRAAPDVHERWFVGGAAERQALEKLRSRQGADVEALQATDVSEIAIDELLAQHRTERKEAAAAHEAAMRQHQRWRMQTLAIAALTLLVACSPRSRRPASWSESLFAALWMITITCGIIGLAVVFAFEGTRSQAIALGLTFSVVGAAATLPLPREDGSTAIAVLAPVGARNRLVNIAFVVWFICFVAAVTAVLADAPSSALAPGEAQIALLVGAALGVAMKLLPSRARRALLGLALPAILAALLVVNVDLLAFSMIGPLVLGVLVGGDARWFGLASALRWLGWPWRSAWVGTMPLIDAAAAQAALAGVFFVSGWLNEPLLASAIVAALACDLAHPLRPRLLTMLNGQSEKQ
ncbi:MAG: hypothetical protein IT430_10560 [Phycisphaerales bacterium]|nr:hypothetical protein [Phycisphaerales bacterium]